MTEQPRGLCRARGVSACPVPAGPLLQRCRPQAVCGPLPTASWGAPPSCQPAPRPPAPQDKASAKEGLRAESQWARRPVCPCEVLGCSGTGGFWGLKLKLSSPVSTRQGLPFSPHTQVTIKFNRVSLRNTHLPVTCLVPPTWGPSALPPGLCIGNLSGRARAPPSPAGA